MDKRQVDIDALFRKRLTGHTVKPSPLAWEKLKGKLAEDRKGGAFRLRIAASFLLLMGFASLLWFSFRSTDGPKNHLAQKEEITEIVKDESSSVKPLQEAPNSPDKGVKPSNKKELPPPLKATASASSVKAGIKEAEEIISDGNVTSMDKPLLVEVEDMELPLLDMDHLIAEKGIVAQEKVEVAYTVKIFSNGIREQAEKETLVKEIEDKIDQIGSLLNKVDQGFAEIQDTKNDLLTSLINKNQ